MLDVLIPLIEDEERVEAGPSQSEEAGPSDTGRIVPVVDITSDNDCDEELYQDNSSDSEVSEEEVEVELEFKRLSASAKRARHAARES